MKVWQKIKDDLIKRILNKEFELDAKFFSLNDLSREYGISDITSRRIISELVKAGYIKSFPGKGSYVKSRLESKTIVLLSDSISDINEGGSLPNIHSEIYKGMLLQCGKMNAELRILSKKYLKNWPLDEKLLLILMGKTDGDDKEFADIFRRPNCKKIYCHVTEHIQGEVSVRIPYGKGIMLAVEHLIESGHKRIAFMCSSLKMRNMALRFDGYYECLKKHNLPVDFNLVKELPGPNIVTDSAAVKDLLSIENPPTAILTANNSRALNVLEFCNKRGIKIPEKVALAAFDDIPESVLVQPRLTVVNTHWDKIGAETVRTILEMAENDRTDYPDVIIKPDLIVREST